MIYQQRLYGRIEWFHCSCFRGFDRMPAKKRFSRRIRSWARRLAGRALSALVVLSLWHAPIPWVHAHDLEGPRVEQLQILSRHVAEFHARELSRGQTHLDWHVHLVLPWCMVHHDSCPDDKHHGPNSDDYFGTLKIGATAAALSARTIGQPSDRAFLVRDVVLDGGLTAPQGVGTCDLDQALHRRSHFFETYGDSISVRDLVGVRLC